MWKVYKDDRRHLIEINSSDVLIFYNKIKGTTRNRLWYLEVAYGSEKNSLKYIFTKILF